MRRTTLMLSTAAALMFAGVPAASAAVTVEPVPAAQDAKIDVNVSTDDGGGAWYVQPVWLAIGGLALLVIIFIAVSAARGKNTTTVVK